MPSFYSVAKPATGHSLNKIGYLLSALGNAFFNNSLQFTLLNHLHDDVTTTDKLAINP